MTEIEHLLIRFLFSLIPVVVLYFSMRDRATKQENRITAIEKDIENLREFRMSANKRLDNHDEQNKAILVLAEQVKSLGEDVRELKTLIQSKQ
ncbi:phage membrane protein [Streptococcus pneumoniae]|nr:phage membrane protein [Streptococcus pneumoniae]